MMKSIFNWCYKLRSGLWGPTEFMRTKRSARVSSEVLRLRIRKHCMFCFKSTWLMHLRATQSTLCAHSEFVFYRSQNMNTLWFEIITSSTSWLSSYFYWLSTGFLLTSTDFMLTLYWLLVLLTLYWLATDFYWRASNFYWLLLTL